MKDDITDKDDIYVVTTQGCICHVGTDRQWAEKYALMKIKISPDVVFKYLC